MKNKKKKKALGVLIAVAIIGLGVFSYYEYTQITALTTENTALTTEMEANKQVVYVATQPITKGDTISQIGDNANVEMQVVYTGIESYNYISEDDMGTTAIVDISVGVPVMYSMVTDVEMANDTRDYEIASVCLATTQSTNDVVDVRITFPDGSDYVVLSQKMINGIDLENCVFSAYLNEEEILRFTCAMVDAYTTTGARLYTTRYVESNIQEEAIPNYPVRDTTRALISADPNVVTVASDTLNASARLELETRLGLLTEDELTAVNDGFGLTDTAKASVLQAKENAAQYAPTDNTTNVESSANETDATDESTDESTGESTESE